MAEALVHTFWVSRAAGGMIPEHGFTAAQVAAPRYQRDSPRIGSGYTLQAHGRRVRVAARIHARAAAVLDGVLDADECDEMIALARPRLAPSTIVDPGSGEDTVNMTRSSEGMFFRLEENGGIASRG